MIPAVLFLRQHALISSHAVWCLSSVNKVVARTCSSASSTLFASGLREWKALPSLKKDVYRSPSMVCSYDVLCQHLYQHLSAGYQIPAVWYNNVMKKSIIDPLLNFQEYDLPTLPGLADRKDMPNVSPASVPVTVGDPNTTEITPKMVLPELITIRRRKMKKHKLKKFRKRMRFVMRRRRQKKAKQKEREIQQYEREQAKLGQAYSAEKYVDEQLALARKSGWHIDIISEFVHEQEKKRAAATAAGSSSHENDNKQ